MDISNLTVVVTTADWHAAAGHLVEAGVDNFKMTSNTAVDQIGIFDVGIYPNPSSGLFNLTNPSDFKSYELYDLSGKLIAASFVNSAEIVVESKGVYLLVLKTLDGSSVTQKIIVY